MTNSRGKPRSSALEHPVQVLPLLKKSTSKTFHFYHSKSQKRHGNISVMKLWWNSVRHLCSVITVAHWRFGVFHHRYLYKHDDFAPVTELFQPAFQRTRVWWRGRHVYDDKVDTCMAGRLTRVRLHGCHVAFSSAFTWQHGADDVATRERWRGIYYIMMFVFRHKNLTNLI